MIQSYTLTGLTPLLMKSSQTIDPTNHFAKWMKEISSKRNKTEADYEELARREWLGSLYRARIEDDERLVIPQQVVRASLINGAKKHRNGPVVAAGVFPTEPFYFLDYDGPKNIDTLWENMNFRFAVPVVVERKSIIRTRPKFDSWSINVEFDIEEDIVTERTVFESLVSAGRLVGIGDWRPQKGGMYGRYSVERVA